MNKKLDENFPDSSTAGKLRYGLFYYDPTDTRAQHPFPAVLPNSTLGRKRPGLSSQVS